MLDLSVRCRSRICPFWSQIKIDGQRKRMHGLKSFAKRAGQVNVCVNSEDRGFLVNPSFVDFLTVFSQTLKGTRRLPEKYRSCSSTTTTTTTTSRLIKTYLRIQGSGPEHRQHSKKPSLGYAFTEIGPCWSDHAENRNM